MSVNAVLLDQLHQALTEARSGAPSRALVMELAALSTDPEYRAFGQVISLVDANANGRRQGQIVDEISDVIEFFQSQDAPDTYFYWSALNCRGVAHFRSGNPQRSINDYSSAVSVVTGSGLGDLEAISEINIAYVRRFAGDPIGAMSALMQAIARPAAIDATRAHGHHFIAQIYADQAYWRRAAQHSRRAIELSGPLDGTKFRSLFAANLLQDGFVVEAEAIIQDINLRSLNSENPILWGHYLVAHGHMLINDDRPLEAGAAFAEALLELPNVRGSEAYVMAQQGLARSHLAAGKADEAIRHLDKSPLEPLFLDQRRRHCDLYIDAYEALGNWQQVSTYEDKMLRLVRDRRVSLATLAKLSQRVEKGEQAALRHRQLRLKSVELRRLKQDRDELIEIVANDLQSPLTTLELAMGMLSDTTSVDVAQRCIEWSESAIDRIGGIATRLGMVTTLEANEWKETRTTTELAIFVSKRVASANRRAASKSISIEAILPDDLIAAELDFAALEFVVDQMIQNAITFTNPGGSIRVHLADSGRAAVISVSDTGQGWEPEEQTRLFAKHSRLSSSPTGSESASGLGLYICRELATLLGGTISAHSEGRDHGAVFTLVAPLPGREFGTHSDIGQSAIR